MLPICSEKWTWWRQNKPVLPQYKQHQELQLQSDRNPRDNNHHKERWPDHHQVQHLWSSHPFNSSKKHHKLPKVKLRKCMLNNKMNLHSQHKRASQNNFNNQHSLLENRSQCKCKNKMMIWIVLKQLAQSKNRKRHLVRKLRQEHLHFTSLN